MAKILGYVIFCNSLLSAIRNIPASCPLRTAGCDSQRLNAHDIRAHGARGQHLEGTESTCPALAGRPRTAIYDCEESSDGNTNSVACDHGDIAVFAPHTVGQARSARLEEACVRRNDDLPVMLLSRIKVFNQCAVQIWPA